MRAAAAAAGHRSLLAPWTPDREKQPELLHRLFTRRL